MSSCANPSASFDQSPAKGQELRRGVLSSVLEIWHLASLDAPSVAAAWSCALAWAAHVHLPAWEPAVLALIAWVVYVIDRLLDARAGMQRPPMHLMRERHYFHWRHRRILAPAAGLAAAAATGLVVTRLPSGARMPDSALAAATLAYFSGIHSRARLWSHIERHLRPIASRAFVIGVLFTAGCLLPAASHGLSLSAARISLALFYAALAWLNCLAIERWETALAPPTKTTGVARMAALVAAAGLVLSAASAGWEPRIAWLAAAGAVSALLFVLLERLRPRLAPVTLRAGADLVLLFPGLVLICAR